MMAAVSRDGVLGRGGGIPWHAPADLRHFRRMTWGKPVIMGRRTMESLGKVLAGRRNIVLTRDGARKFPEGFGCAHACGSSGVGGAAC